MPPLEHNSPVMFDQLHPQPFNAAELELVGILSNIFVRNPLDRAWLRELAKVIRQDPAYPWPLPWKVRLRQIGNLYRPQLPRHLHKLVRGMS